MTNRLQSNPQWSDYDMLVREAVLAFSQDIAYVIEIVESARSLSDKRRRAQNRLNQ